MTWHWLAIGVSTAWIAFAYAGYPLVLWWLARRSPRPLRAGDRFPQLSVIIAVHNGEKLLRRKLEGTLSLNYPGFIAPLVKALQEMEAEWEAGQIVYNREIGELKAADDNLRRELKAANENYQQLRIRMDLLEHQPQRPATMGGK